MRPLNSELSNAGVYRAGPDSVLYYKTLDRYVVLSLSNILGTVDDLDKHQAEKVMLLLHAYLKAEQPIRNIVDTALDPYVEDLDELLHGGSQIG